MSDKGKYDYGSYDSADANHYYYSLRRAVRDNGQWASYKELERLCQQVIAYARWGVDDDDASVITTLNWLASTALTERKLTPAISQLSGLLHQQEATLGPNHPALAHTEFLIGICQQEQKQTDKAVRSLRSAIVRMQQSDEVDRDLLVRCLCRLSSLYRLSPQYRGLRALDAARTCLKQAYRALPDNDDALYLQALVIEELGAVLTAERKPKLARAAYRRLVAMRYELAKSGESDVLQPLISLSLCNFGLRRLDEAEAAIVQAAEFFYASRCTDRQVLARILTVFSYLLRCRGLFSYADLVEREALEASNIHRDWGHIDYGPLLIEGYAAQDSGDVETAKIKYRQALCELETQRERHGLDRLPILARLYLCTNSMHQLQRDNILFEIEDELANAHPAGSVELLPALRTVSRLYLVCGKKQLAKDLFDLAAMLESDTPLLPSGANALMENTL